ncbi:MAG TPA: trimeric intracellular cation channel family protein [Candidatus Acidoferrales bacterium]
MPNPLLKYNPRRLLLFADLAGTLIFGIEGATAAVYGNLDFLGLMVLAFSTALAGGIFRDLLIGAVPPASLRDWRYPATAFAGGALVFFLYRFLVRIPPSVMIDLDAMGLALFAVAGTEKALDYELSPFIAVLLGTVTAVGGGTVRDIFLAQVPRVLNTDVYATAALVGATALVACRKLRVPPVWAAVAGGSVCFFVRIVAVSLHWNLPKVTNP